MPVGEGAAMNSWLAWIVTAAVAVTLGAVGYHFSLRTLRWVALIIALATAAYLTVYGLTHPGQKPGSLSDEFARSADMLSTALIRPVSLGHTVPAPGQIGWLAIVVLLVLAYRALEVWALRRQAPCLDTSALTSDRQDTTADAAANTQAGKQRHDWLVAELKFRLPSVEVRSPAILPGGSRPSGLASIAEATGVNGAGLAGAIIRFFGMIWPSAPKIQVRAWVEQSPGPVRCEHRHQDPGRGKSRRRRCRGGRLRRPAHLRPGPHRAAVERQRDRRGRPGGAAACPAGSRLPGMPQRHPRRLEAADRDPGSRGARQPVRRRRPVRAGAAVRPDRKARRGAVAARHQPGAVSALLPRALPPRHVPGDAHEPGFRARGDRPGHAEGRAADPRPVQPGHRRRQPGRRRPDRPAGRPGTPPASCRMAGTARDRALPDVAAHHLGRV